jgi:hypothetical protein
MVLLVAGAGGMGVVWGWLVVLLGTSGRGRRRIVGAAWLALATAALAAESGWLGGAPALVAFVAGAPLGACLHAGLRRWLRRSLAPVT